MYPKGQNLFISLSEWSKSWPVKVVSYFVSCVGRNFSTRSVHRAQCPVMFPQDSLFQIYSELQEASSWIRYRTSEDTLFLPYSLAVVSKRDSFVCTERLAMFVDRRRSTTSSACTSWPATLGRTLLQCTHLAARGSRNYLEPDAVVTSSAQSFLPILSVFSFHLSRQQCSPVYKWTPIKPLKNIAFTICFGRDWRVKHVTF